MERDQAERLIVALERIAESLSIHMFSAISPDFEASLEQWQEWTEKFEHPQHLVIGQTGPTKITGGWFERIATALEKFVALAEAEKVEYTTDEPRINYADQPEEVRYQMLRDLVGIFGEIGKPTKAVGTPFEVNNPPEPTPPPYPPSTWTGS